MARGIALDTNNDIIIGGTQVTRVSDAEYLAQKIRSKLQLIQGESQLDTEEGIPYFTDVFVKPVDLPLVGSLFKTLIINTEGVNELLTFEYELDTTERLLTINFSINTDFGDIDITDFTINTGA
jgi:hypothetical protein